MSRLKRIMKRCKATCQGYTLIELLIVVGIIGILAGVAGVTYFTYLKRARQIEARVVLNNLRKMQDTHYSIVGNYGTMNEIGFSALTQAKYYTVTLELIVSDDGLASGYIATATANLDADGDLDVWKMGENGNTIHLNVD